MDLISIIVPVYKVEPYLDQCVQSIVDQTYKNLEIILVDDGSPDNCPAICDAWAKKDSRIRVIHKKNGGLSDARNAGIAAATGKYVGFVDSDDWIEPNFYETLHATSAESHCDLTAAGIIWAYEDHFQPDSHFYSQRNYTPEEALATLIHGRGFYAVAWNKLYCASLFQEIHYPVGKLHEDEFVTYRLLGKAKKLALCTDTHYFYRQRNDSIMGSWSSRHLDALDAYSQRLDYLQEHFPSLYLEDKITFLRSCAWFYSCCEGIEDQKEAQARIYLHSETVRFSYSEYMRMKPIDVLQIFRARWRLSSVKKR